MNNLFMKEFYVLLKLLYIEHISFNDKTNIQELCLIDREFRRLLYYKRISDIIYTENMLLNNLFIQNLSNLYPEKISKDSDIIKYV